MSDKAHTDLRARTAKMQDAYHYALLVTDDGLGNESAFVYERSGYSTFRDRQRSIKYAVAHLAEYGIVVETARLSTKAGLKLTGERIIAAIRKDEMDYGYSAYADELKPVLVDERGEPLTVGQRIVDFRGEAGVLKGWREPRYPEESMNMGARVVVRMDDDSRDSEYFPSVIGAKFVKGSSKMCRCDNCRRASKPLVSYAGLRVCEKCRDEDVNG